MKRIYHITTLITLLLFSTTLLGNEDANEVIARLLNEMDTEISNRSTKFYKEIAPKELLRSQINLSLQKTTRTKKIVQLLLKKDDINNQVAKIESRYESDIAKIRYLKGLQIIKILYDKTLALDHHFASVSTLNDINKMANPNQYEDFREVQMLLSEKKDKKMGFNLSSLLGDNIYTAVVHSFVSLFTNNETSKTEKEMRLQSVECILDFTLRMHNDLNTIYFETAFLQKNNEAIMAELEQLFKDYTRPINYKTNLKTCRENDEWSDIRSDLSQYLGTMNEAIEAGNQPSQVRNMQINLQFPIDRLLQFITQYNAFIDQGTKFYEKFGIMLSSYENEVQCASKIPREYTKMKENINLSIEKFNTAYRPIEINGSKLKELLYGINEYEH